MSKSSDIEQGRPGSSIDKKWKLDGVSDGASFIECSIYVPGYEWRPQFFHWKVESLGEILIDKGSSGSTIN